MTQSLTLYNFGGSRRCSELGDSTVFLVRFSRGEVVALFSQRWRTELLQMFGRHRTVMTVPTLFQISHTLLPFEIGRLESNIEAKYFALFNPC